MVDAAKGMLDDLSELGDTDETPDLDSVETPGVDKMISTEREPREVEEPDDGEEVEAEVEEEPEEKPKATADSPDRPKGFVPEAALAELRNELRESKRTTRQYEDTLQRFLDTKAQEAQQKPEPEVEEDPEPAEDDYVGQIQWLRAKMAKAEAKEAERLAGEQKRNEESRQQAEQRKAWEQAEGAVGQYWSTKAAEQPDLPALYEALKLNVAQEFIEVNGISTERELVDAINNWKNNLVADCFNNKKPIDQVVRRLAKVRNVTPAQIEQAEAEEAKTPDRDEQGRFKAEQEKAARIKEGQERNGSLSQASGVPVEKMTAKEFAKLSEEEQHRILSQMSGTKGFREFERTMGFT